MYRPEGHGGIGSDIHRRARATVRNTVVWGIGWAVLGFLTTLLLRATGVVNAPVSVPDALTLGLKIGIGGGIAGAAFSAFIAFAYRNRRIQDIGWLRFGIGGALVTVASITAFVQTANLLSGSGLVPWRYMQSTLAMFAVFGFGVAAVSMRLAQRAALQAPDGEATLLDSASGAQLTAGESETPLQQRVEADITLRRD